MVRQWLNKLTEVVEETERLLIDRRPEGLASLGQELLAGRNPERLMERLKVVGGITFDKWFSRDYDELDVRFYNQNVVLNNALHRCRMEMQKALYGFPLPGGRELGLGARKVPILKILRGASGSIRYHDDPRPLRALARPVEPASHWQPTLRGTG